MSKCTFRAAVPGDEALILKFIYELAVYEKMNDQVVATPELLREWIFEKQKQLGKSWRVCKRCNCPAHLFQSRKQKSKAEKHRAEHASFFFVVSGKYQNDPKQRQKRCQRARL